MVVTTPADLEEMLEDAAATAAFHTTRDQERVPIEMVDRLIAGETRSRSGASIAAYRNVPLPSGRV